MNVGGLAGVPTSYYYGAPDQAQISSARDTSSIRSVDHVALQASKDPMIPGPRSQVYKASTKTCHSKNWITTDRAQKSSAGDISSIGSLDHRRERVSREVRLTTQLQRCATEKTG